MKYYSFYYIMNIQINTISLSSIIFNYNNCIKLMNKNFNIKIKQRILSEYDHQSNITKPERNLETRRTNRSNKNIVNNNKSISLVKFGNKNIFLKDPKINAQINYFQLELGQYQFLILPLYLLGDTLRISLQSQDYKQEVIVIEASTKQGIICQKLNFKKQIGYLIQQNIEGVCLNLENLVRGIMRIKIQSNRSLRQLKKIRTSKSDNNKLIDIHFKEEKILKAKKNSKYQKQMTRHSINTIEKSNTHLHEDDLNRIIHDKIREMNKKTSDSLRKPREISKKIQQQQIITNNYKIISQYGIKKSSASISTNNQSRGESGIFRKKMLQARLKQFKESTNIQELNQKQKPINQEKFIKQDEEYKQKAQKFQNIIKNESTNTQYIQEKIQVISKPLQSEHSELFSPEEYIKSGKSINNGTDSSLVESKYED